jgi:hypothetical protein
MFLALLLLLPFSIGYIPPSGVTRVIAGLSLAGDTIMYGTGLLNFVSSTFSEFEEGIDAEYSLERDVFVVVGKPKGNVSVAVSTSSQSVSNFKFNPLLGSADICQLPNAIYGNCDDLEIHAYIENKKMG